MNCEVHFPKMVYGEGTMFSALQLLKPGTEFYREPASIQFMPYAL